MESRVLRCNFSIFHFLSSVKQVVHMWMFYLHVNDMRLYNAEHLALVVEAVRILNCLCVLRHPRFRPEI